jgi:hypothetical protein
MHALDAIGAIACISVGRNGDNGEQEWGIWGYITHLCSDITHYITHPPSFFFIIITLISPLFLT